VLALGVFVSLACAMPKARTEAIGFSSEGFGPAWDDVGRCRQAVAQSRTSVRKAGVVRVGTWNIKWFPDGRPGNSPDENGGTDIQWLACAIAYLDVDVLALQEVKLTERGFAAKTELVQALDALTHTTWRFETDSCRDPYRQHVGLLYRTDRVDVTEQHTHPEIDPTESRAKDPDPACRGNLRPAFAAYVKSKAGGLDFHLATSHLDSGREERDIKNRVDAWGLIAKVAGVRRDLVVDDDFVFLGDFNTMGCKKCSTPSPALERSALAAAMTKSAPELVLAETSAQCSQYYRGEAVLLDQVVVSRSMREAYGSMQVIEGVCARSGCKHLETDQLPAFTRLSDHCPVLFDLRDVDDDDATARTSAR
jgi:endonuclease/exonuclease/phosphatase family metal-dependent hydrolase